jgi:protein involved in sex pheromone biosynthesis
MKPLLLYILTSSVLLSGCGAGVNVTVVVDNHHHSDNHPITLTQISACPNSANGYLSHVYGCMTGLATGQVSYSNQVCSLAITESGRIALGIAGSNYSQSFYIYPDDAYYTKLPGLTLGSFELIASNANRNFSLFVAWPGAVLPSGGAIATMSVSIGSLSCNFLL